MRFPVENYETKWYSAQKFGEKTSYGYHEGEDINLKTGGDSDIGQPICSIANGVVTSVHSHTTIPTFGNHIHVKHDGPWGTVYSHCAHCDQMLVKTGDAVKEGQQIATVGKSGTTVAHLHFAIKTMPTGIDGIAKTLDDLSKWVPPFTFIKQWQGENMAETVQLDGAKFTELVTKATRYDELVKEGISQPADIQKLRDISNEYRTQMEKSQVEAKSCREELGDLKQSIADKLGSTQDLPRMLGAIDEIVNTIDQLTRKTKLDGEEIREYERQVTDLKSEINRLQLLLKANNSLSQATMYEMLVELFNRVIKILQRN